VVGESRDSADIGAAFVDVDGGLVVRVNDAGGCEGTKGLCDDIEREFSPGKATVDAH